MFRRISLALILLLLCSEFVWAQRAKVAQEDDRAARKRWEEEQRADEYATSLRRRDWLKDRLILELGMGTKFPVMGANWFGFGAGAEYITRWHAAAFISAGFIPQHEDPAFPEWTLEGGIGWRVGLAYYMFEKSPIHLGFHASYGTVFYDHQSADTDRYTGEVVNDVRPIILCRGYEFDISISYLSDQWYFLQALIGIYTIGNGMKDTGSQDNEATGHGTFGRTNDSWRWDIERSEYVSLVEVNSSKPNEAIPPVGVVFGIGIGFAFEEFFPDDTEIRRREREGRSKQSNQFRSPGAGSSRPVSTPRRSSSVTEDEDED
jgi:hypothetical protein